MKAECVQHSFVAVTHELNHTNHESRHLDTHVFSTWNSRTVLKPWNTENHFDRSYQKIMEQNLKRVLEVQFQKIVFSMKIFSCTNTRGSTYSKECSLDKN